MPRVDITAELRKQTFLSHFLCMIIGNSREEYFQYHANLDEESGHQVVDIEMTFNGLPVDPVMFIRHLEESYQESIRRRAGDTLYLQFNNLTHKMGQFSEELEEWMNRNALTTDTHSVIHKMWEDLMLFPDQRMKWERILKEKGLLPK